MDSLGWFIAIAVVAATGILKFLLAFNNWWYDPVLKPGQAPLPPGTLGWPIFGNMGEYLRAFKSGHPDSFMQDYITKYKRVGIYKAFLFWQPTVLAATPEACKLVLCRDSFESGWPRSSLDLIGRKSFSGLFGQEHYKLRKLVDPVLKSPRALQEYIPFIVRNTRTCLERWSTHEKIVLLPEARKLIFLTILHILYGETAGLDVDEAAALYFRMNNGVRAFPINLPGTAFNKALKARRRLDKLIQHLIDERRRKSTEKTQRMDTLSLLLDCTDDKGDGLEDAQIIDLLNMFMNAGHDSTAHIIMWLTVMLEKHPAVLKRLKVEQREIANRKGPGEILSLADIKQMPYLTAVVDETLRMSNIAPFVFRKALVDVEFKGFTIPKGWHAEAWIRQVHMDPYVHPDPQNFDPDRWARYAAAGTSPFTFIPFGLGKRACPGNELAKLQIFIVVHHLVTGYEWRCLNPNARVTFLPHPRPEDLYPIKITKVHMEQQ